MRQEKQLGRVLGAMLAAAFAVAGVAHAFAPPGQYDFYGPAKKEITDLKTGLTWQRYPDPQLWTFPEAVASCVVLGQDWRLPTVKELLTLVDEQPMHEWVGGKLTYPPIDSNAFPRTPPSNFWTGSRDGAFVYVVDFEFGTTATRKTSKDTAYVRCVKNK